MRLFHASLAAFSSIFAFDEWELRKGVTGMFRARKKQLSLVFDSISVCPHVQTLKMKKSF